MSLILGFSTGTGLARRARSKSTEGREWRVVRTGVSEVGSVCTEGTTTCL